MCVMGRRTLKVRLYDAFLSVPLTGTSGVGGSPTTACLQSEGGARASKGAYTFHRSQMGNCELQLYKVCNSVRFDWPWRSVLIWHS